jgi:hypothetical protein
MAFGVETDIARLEHGLGGIVGSVGGRPAQDRFMRATSSRSRYGLVT